MTSPTTPTAGTGTAAHTVRVFEPALCCATGVCGTDVDEALVAFTGDIAALQAAGADVARTNLGTDPQAFAADPTAVAFLRTAGSEGLPLTVVDGTTALTGRYPTRAELERWTGTSAPAAGAPAAPEGASHLGLTDVSAGGSCGCGGTGCC